MKSDEFEPVEIVAGLKQVFPTSLQLPLNRNGWADYVWDNYNSDPVGQLERKQAPEIVSNLDSVEEQIRKELQSKPDIPLTLLIEGITEPLLGGIQTYVLTPDNKVFRKGRFFKTRYDRYEGFLLGLESQGVRIWRTSSWQGTVQALVRFQKQALDPEHTILNRYVKIPLFHPDPMVQTLMGIKGAEIGPKTAEALIEVFGTVWDVMRQDVDTLAKNTPGMGKVSAQKMLDSIKVRK